MVDRRDAVPNSASDGLETRLDALAAAVAVSDERAAEQQRLLAEMGAKLDALARSVETSARLLAHHDSQASRRANKIMGYEIAEFTRIEHRLQAGFSFLIGGPEPSSKR